jgi:hypothetical protein
LQKRAQRIALSERGDRNHPGPRREQPDPEKEHSGIPRQADHRLFYRRCQTFEMLRASRSSGPAVSTRQLRFYQLIIWRKDSVVLGRAAVPSLFRLPDSNTPFREHCAYSRMGRWMRFRRNTAIRVPRTSSRHFTMLDSSIGGELSRLRSGESCSPQSRSRLFCRISWRTTLTRRKTGQMRNSRSPLCAYQKDILFEGRNPRRCIPPNWD